MGAVALSCSTAGSEKIGLSDIFRGNRPLPEGYRSVYIENVQGDSIDKTVRESALTSIRNRINSSSQLSLSGSSAKSDILLIVRITWFSSEPVKFNALGIAEERRLRIAAIVTLKFTGTSASESRGKVVEAEQIYSDTKLPAVSEYRAVELLSDKLAERIVSVIITGWYDEK